MKAIISGIAIESILFSILSVIGWGPCGPGSPVGYVLMLLHYPGLWALELGQKLHLPEWTALPMIFGVSAGIWGLVVCSFLRWGRRSL